MKFKRMIACIACLVISGGAALAQSGDETGSFSIHKSISDIYSRVDLYVKLAFAAARPYDAFEAVSPECAGPTPFEKRVIKMGERLAAAAYAQHPGLKSRIPKFEFTVSDRAEPGVASTAGGLIVVLTPVSEISLTDEALAFVIAREMGHVISRHHEQNTAISIAFSLAATVLAPVLNLGRLLAFASTGASNTLAVNSVSSAASYASSRAVIASYGERQRKAADALALQLLPVAGLQTHAVPHGVAPVCAQEPPNRWHRHFEDSVAAIPPLPTPMAQVAPATEVTAVSAARPALSLPGDQTELPK